MLEPFPFHLDHIQRKCVSDNNILQSVTLWYRAPEILLGCLEYSFAVDIWSIGCIIAEMHLKRPLFQGEYDIDQLYKIFRIMGTPNVNVWPDVVTLQHYKKTFPQWSPKNLRDEIPTLSSLEADLISRMLVYDPNHRISAKQALNHVRFNNIECNSLISKHSFDLQIRSRIFNGI